MSHAASSATGCGRLPSADNARPQEGAGESCMRRSQPCRVGRVAPANAGVGGDAVACSACCPRRRRPPRVLERPAAAPHDDAWVNHVGDGATYVRAGSGLERSVPGVHDTTLRAVIWSQVRSRCPRRRRGEMASRSACRSGPPELIGSAQWWLRQRCDGPADPCGVERSDQSGDLVVVVFEGEVAGVEKVQLGVGHVELRPCRPRA